MEESQDGAVKEMMDRQDRIIKEMAPHGVVETLKELVRDQNIRNMAGEVVAKDLMGFLDSDGEEPKDSPTGESLATRFSDKLNENDNDYDGRTRSETRRVEKDILDEVAKEHAFCFAESSGWADLSIYYPIEEVTRVWIFKDGSVMLFTDFEGMRCFYDFVPVDPSKMGGNEDVL